MEYIGKLVNTHGIKGEVRIKSNFRYKEEAFKIDNIIIINNQEYKIKNYRVHKDFDMLTFYGINDINDVINLKGKSVYIDRKYLSNIDVLDSDIIGMDVFSNNKYYGKVVDIKKGVKNDFLEISNHRLIPYIDEFILNIEKKTNKIQIKYIKGLIDDED